MLQHIICEKMISIELNSLVYTVDKLHSTTCAATKMHFTYHVDIRNSGNQPFEHTTHKTYRNPRLTAEAQTECGCHQPSPAFQNAPAGTS